MDDQDKDLIEKQMEQLNKAFIKGTGHSLQQFNMEFEVPSYIRALGFKNVLRKFKEGLFKIEELPAARYYKIVKGLCRNEIELKLQRENSKNKKAE